VKAALRGIKRSVSTAPARKTPVLAETARAMAVAAPVGLKGLQDRAVLLLGFYGNLRVTKTTGRQIIRVAANNAWSQLPFTATVVRNPSVHAQDVQGAHRVEADPFPHLIAESDIAIKLVPRLAGPD
jgi:hypothetical protein